MAKCIACGKSSLLSHAFGTGVICNSCARKIDFDSWKKDVFDSMEDVMSKKAAILNLANSNGFSPAAVQYISDYFDTYINAGFITAVDGKVGQILKVFPTYCVIDTKNESRKEELVDVFEEFWDDDEDDDISIFNSNNASALVKGLMSGKLMTAGIGVAASAFIDSKAREQQEIKKAHTKEKLANHVVTVGSKKIPLNGITKIDILTRKDIPHGCLRFVPDGISPSDHYSCVYYFFKNTNSFEGKRLKQQIVNVCNMLNDQLSSLSTVQSAQAHTTNTQSENTDIFAEIRKYKELLDDGIITDDEFNLKKKELLGL